MLEPLDGLTLAIWMESRLENEGPTSARAFEKSSGAWWHRDGDPPPSSFDLRARAPSEGCPILVVYESGLVPPSG